MYVNTLKKNKIILSDYSYKKDIDNRLYLATLSPFEIQVLQELTYFSTKFDVEELADSLSCSSDVLIPLLDRLSITGLLFCKDSTVFVDKDVRKYFESQLALFDEDFEADFEYLQTLLKKVPISILPTWYSIPRTSDNIFLSLIEKYLLTPKLYEKYLQELVFDEPICRQILDELLQNPIKNIKAQDFRKRLTLSKEKLAECLLLCEFHFAAVLTFTLVDGAYIEEISLFREYKDYWSRQEETKPQAILETEIEGIQATPFQFLSELQSFLTTSDTSQICNQENLQKKCEDLGLITGYNDAKTLTDEAHYFVKLPVQDQAFMLFRKTLENMQRDFSGTFGILEKHVHELERALNELAFTGWITFDAFYNALIAPIGTQKTVQLKRVGKKWCYEMPAYTEQEHRFTRFVILELFFEMGITSCATYQGKECFTVTPFGHIVLNE